MRTGLPDDGGRSFHHIIWGAVQLPGAKGAEKLVRELTGSLPKILEYICSGYDAAQIARAMGSDINLVALKVSKLISRRYPFREIARRDDFLRGIS